MSTFKKQTDLRWKANTQRTSCGRGVVCTVWTAKVGRLDLEVTNYPGSDTLDWRITCPGTEWWQGSDESRYETSVSQLKDKTYTKAVEILAKWDAKLKEKEVTSEH